MYRRWSAKMKQLYYTKKKQYNVCLVCVKGSTAFCVPPPCYQQQEAGWGPSNEATVIVH